MSQMNRRKVTGLRFARRVLTAAAAGWSVAFVLGFCTAVTR